MVAKSNRKQPTTKQKKVIELVKEKVSKGQHFSKAEIIRNAGYGKSMIRRPDKVFESLNVVEMIKYYFPKEELFNIHRELVLVKKISSIEFDINTYDKDIYFIMRDVGEIVNIVEGNNKKVVYYKIPTNLQLKALDMAYKINGTYKESEKKEENVLIQLFNKIGEEERIKKEGMKIDNNIV
ncbi:MAG: hypothetical protein PHS92_03895 [Candidatus Gracilibacteria bacterium]|nr:hypothetical protein [Candidatus Gracilibacteria bacterium]